MFKINFDRRFITVVAVLISLFIFSSTSNAQTKKKPATKPVATPTPVPLSAAEIISRAGDQTEPTVLVQQPITKPAEEEPVDPNVQKIKDLSTRVKKLETAKVDPYDERQKRLLLNLDILTRAEQRSESLRKQLFDMIEKESSVKARLDQNETDSRPEIISRAATFSGSMKPEEVREMRKKSLDSERQNLQALLGEIQSTRVTLASNLAKADALVEKLRAKLEKDIDDSFKDDDPDK